MTLPRSRRTVRARRGAAAPLARALSLDLHRLFVAAQVRQVRTQRAIAEARATAGGERRP